MFYYISIMIVVLSNVFYHLSSKKVPTNLNPFFFVMVSYVVGFILAAVAFTVSIKGENIGAAYLEQGRLVNWTPVILGVSVIGLEVGNVMMYRAGWDISKGALICNILLAFVLVAVGASFFKEDFTLKHMAGLISCVIGIYLLA